MAKRAKVPIRASEEHPGKAGVGRLGASAVVDV
jgi:hypothetical protein